MIEFKGLREALSLRSVRPELIAVLKATALWSNREGYQVVVTSLNDHQHSSPKSLHFRDLAADLQIRNKGGGPNKRAMKRLAGFLTTNLGYGFDVIFGVTGHYTHIHVEYDENERPRKNAD